MWGVLLVLWFGLAAQLRFLYSKHIVFAYALQTAAVFCACFLSLGEEENVMTGLTSETSILFSLASITILLLFYLRPRQTGGYTKEAFSRQKASLMTAFSLGTAYAVLDHWLPFAAGRDFMATGAALTVLGLILFFYASAPLTRFFGLCTVNNGIFLFVCFLRGDFSSALQAEVVAAGILFALVLFFCLYRLFRNR